MSDHQDEEVASTAWPKDEFIAMLRMHLPDPSEHPITEKWARINRKNPDDDDMLISYLTAAFMEPSGYISAWDYDKEVAKLDKLAQIAREFTKAYESLPEEVRFEMDDATAKFAKQYDLRSFVPVEVHGRPSPELSEIVMMLDAQGYVEAAVEAGMKELEAGVPKGRRDWRAVCLVDSCRDIWHRRTGAEAPINVNPASPFGKFIHDVFEAFGFKAGKAITAARSWEKVHSKGQIY